MKFEPVIGLEVHAQLKTSSKIFCSCSTEYGAPPNTHTCPICLGMPGVLPVLNRKVVDFTLRMGIATSCEIVRKCRFARKNYFYPDLPKGYQISQYELPIAQNGHVIISVAGQEKKVGITRIHMEEDAGKLSHDTGRPVSRVDYNRTGVPLMEIVSEPDISSPQEAGAYLRQLRAIVRYLDVCDGNMEQGSFRCDANISLRPLGSKDFGVRSEIKNLNSFRHVEKALQHEILRQREILMEGGGVIQEPRLWDQQGNKTISMRGKEMAHDYRYFPDPDLLPIVISEDWISEISEHLPELPASRRKRFIEDFGLIPDDADLLTANQELGDFFEVCVSIFPNPGQVCNWVSGSLLGFLNTSGKDLAELPISPVHLAELLGLIDTAVISGKIAKEVFKVMAESGDSPETIVKEKGLSQVSDSTVIDNIAADVLSANPKQVADYLSGKTKILGFFVGQIMKASHGKANPKIVNEVLIKKLKKMEADQ